ncbi:MarR family transcriptional regulator [Thermogymnomonas acidicola]|uniref:MarR family winged helix-turn-helix transcriptional regulator n=1 Tax=Thermogymnomonas acidicola TaxID=399579 RepID=UPI0013967E6D|nr:MarR family transcriptional regulator [Thermogymnomonas acidicola]
MIAVLREGSDVEPINIWRLYSRTWKKWYRCVERNLSSLGLGGVNDYSTIRILSEEGECNMAYLAEMLHVSQGWMTGLIDKLEERGGWSGGSGGRRGQEGHKDSHHRPREADLREGQGDAHEVRGEIAKVVLQGGAQGVLQAHRKAE